MSVYEGLSETQQFACRVIADHARSTAFAIADGILPGNEGRNYVLRKIMRRAIYHGREHLGLQELFFYKVCDFVIGEMHDAYPELEVQREFIAKIVRLEEQRFANTMTVGLERLNFVIPNLAPALEPYRKAMLMLIERKPEIDAALAKMFAPLVENLQKLNEALKPSQSAIAAIVKASHEISSRIRPTMISLAKFAASPEFVKLKDDYDKIERIIKDVDAKSNDSKHLMFKELAKLYDTYGTPRDLIRIGLAEHDVEIEEVEFNDRFDAALKEIQKQSGIGQTERKSQISPIYSDVLEMVGANNFHGYNSTYVDEAKVVALVKDDEIVELLNDGDEGLIVLNNTPFYAEAGGQVGDTGLLVGIPPPAIVDGTELDCSGIATNAESIKVKVLDTFAPVVGLILHKSKIEKGTVRMGDIVTASVDVQKRDATRRNHTATHLVHAALREVLGTHVKQAGSVVAPSYLRFDFTHYQPISESELREVEDLVNRHILENHPVNTNVMAIEEAMHGGAMALFGEKYGADVRVLSVGDGIFSKELCGGTHVKATGDIGSFKITSDEAIASGVRRIRAITGFDAFERFREDERLIDRSLGALKTQRDNLPNAIERLQEELKRTRKEIDDLKLKIATGTIGTGSSNGDEAKDVAGVQVLGKIVDGLDANGSRQLSDTLLTRLKSGVVVLGRKDGDKVSIIVRVSDDLTEKVKAGNIIKEIAPIIGGRGGGKADMAEGGGSEPDKLPDAIEASYGVIERMLD